MTVRKYQLIIAGLVLVVGFQNCSKSAFETSGQEEQASKLQGVVQDDGTIGDSPGFPNPDQDVIIQSSSKVASVSGYDETGQTDIKIELQGEAVVTHRSSDMVIVAGCLDSKRLNFLKKLLNGASLCQADRIKDSSLGCTQEYKIPYATLGILNTQVSLGGGNPCSGNQVYFCSDSTQGTNIGHQLKVFLRDLKNNLKSLDKCI